MTQYLIRRIAAMLPVFIMMTVIVFVLIRLIPGDPIDVMYGSEGMDEARRAVLMKDLGLDQPLPIQYLRWLGRAVTGDLGRSYRAQMPVLDLILQRLPATIFLSFSALIFSVVIAFPLGILAAVRRNTSADVGAMGFAVLGLSLPQFWLGILLVLVFSVYLGWLPSIGYVPPSEDFFGFVSHMILPAITLGWGLAAATTRLTRNSLLDELDAEYVRTARAKGLHEQTILWGHALRNALIPTVTMVGLQLAFLIGGAVVVEVVFALPGIGMLMVDSIFSRDYPVVQGVIITIAILVVVVNVAIDVLYTLIDPRIRLE